jgi:hypothetical protein
VLARSRRPQAELSTGVQSPRSGERAKNVLHGCFGSRSGNGSRALDTSETAPLGIDAATSLRLPTRSGRSTTTPYLAKQPRRRQAPGRPKRPCRRSSPTIAIRPSSAPKLQTSRHRNLAKAVARRAAPVGESGCGTSGPVLGTARLRNQTRWHRPYRDAPRARSHWRRFARLFRRERLTDKSFGVDKPG